jgi:outer membrane lipoprotein SlyB
MDMKRILCVGLAAAVALPALAQDPPGPIPPAAVKPAALGMYVYPGSGQDAGKQAEDENFCYTWARQQTGVDPTVAAAPVEAAEVPRGDTVKGAAGGAVVGTAVGAIAGGTGEGAAIGAVAGAAKGRRTRKKKQKEAEAQAQQATQNQNTQQKDTFKKAWGACLEGRGYSVK